ncbi:MAG TPA: hypothetical protein VFH73_09670 [Polyangia bacterium]|jgi:hypothetical protein|nr:hypothetical protein [Polyangia bacterium]
MNILPKFLQRFVVVALLGVWFSPAVSAAVPVNTAPLPCFATAPLSRAAMVETAPVASTATQAQGYAEREKQATELEQFQGGAVYLYFGSGAVLVLLIVLLLLL